MADTTPVTIGDIHIHVHPAAAAEPEPVDRAAIIREYLDMVDPTALEAEALAGLDTTGSVVVSLLTVLHAHAGDT